MGLAELLGGGEYFLVLLRHIGQHRLGAFKYGLKFGVRKGLSNDIADSVGLWENSVNEIISDVSLSANRGTRDGTVLSNQVHINIERKQTLSQLQLTPAESCVRTTEPGKPRAIFFALKEGW